MTDIASGSLPRRPLFRMPDLSRILMLIAGLLVGLGLRLMPEDNYIRYARAELRRAGLDRSGSSYGGMLATSTIALLKLFGMEGHSGGSAAMQSGIFDKLSRFQPLTPLTGYDDEWMEVGHGLYQNVRCSRVFKDADGLAYDIDGKVFREPSGACFTSYESRVPVTFPYVPATEYVDVPASANE